MGARPAAAITAAALAAAMAACTSIAPEGSGGADRDAAPGGTGGREGVGHGRDRRDGRDAAEQATGSRRVVADRAGGGPRLVLIGHGELWEVDVRAERARRIGVPGLSGGDPPYWIVRRGGRFVIWSGGTFVTGRKLDAAAPLEPLARRAWFYLPSTHPRRVWLTYISRDSAATDLRFRAVREVTASGRVTVPDARPPRGWPERATRSGLLLSLRGGPLVLWDPRSRTVLNRLDGVRLGNLGPVAGDTLASCVWPCKVLRLTDVRTGDQRRIEAPARRRYEIPYGAFSPDGRRLAMPIRTARRAGRELGIVDLDSGATRVVPGSRVPRGYTLVDWSRDGRHVFLTGGQWRSDRAIVWYRRGARRATRVDVRIDAFYGMAAR